MGYFPLPELKGKPNRILVDGKTLNQIAKESGIRLDTVQHRYSRGIRDYEGLTKPSHIRVEHEKAQRKTYSIMSAGERVMERIWELDIPLQTISDKTGISRSTIYAFLYNGTDLSSMRLAKICSSFNPTLREKFITFVQRLQSMEIQFSSKDFRELDLDTLGENDFVYCDPPYLITVASYNENGGWGEQAERDLLDKLDALDKAGVKFGLSNVFESKGKENTILKEWAKGYTVHYLDHTYSNCSYHKKDKQSKDIEVFITNY